MPSWVIALAAAGGALLVAVAIFAMFTTWRMAKNQREQAAAAEALGAFGPDGSIRASMITRSRAEFSRETANRGFETVRKTPSDHPSVLRRLIEIQGRLVQADKAFGEANYAQAVLLYEGITNDTNAFGKELEDMRKAREGADKFRVEVARLEKFKPLAPDDFDEAVAAAGAAIQFLDTGSFSLAREKMDEATAKLATIEKSIAKELEDKLAEGRVALGKGDGPAAAAAFERALELQPGNEVAVKGLERAKTIGEVFSLIAEAERLEKSGALEDAQKNFEKAFALDGQSATAQAGIARLKAAIKQRDFDTALARAQGARNDKKWDDAIAAYEAALKHFPDHADVKKQLAEARVLQREAFIQRSLADAYAYERDYDWKAANTAYLRLLDFQPKQPDAEEGLLRTGKVIRALLKFEKMLEESRAQAQRANFVGAIESFNEAMASKPSYLSLTPDQEQLKNLLELQSREVEVTFNSDNKTSVTINGVRILGKFRTTTVPIRPGNYEVVGKRRGYDDVRLVIRVRADEPVPPVTVMTTQLARR